MGTEEEGLKDPKEQVEQLTKENEQLREMNCILEMEREGRSTIEADLYRELEALQDSEEKLKKHLKKYKALLKTMRKLLHDFDLDMEGDDDQEGDEVTGKETGEKKEGGSDDTEMQNFGGSGGGEAVPPPAGGDETESNVEDVDGGAEQSSSKEGGGEEVEVKLKEEAAISPDVTVPATPSSSSKKQTPGAKRRRRSKKGDGLPKKADSKKQSPASQLDLSSPGKSSEPNSEGLDASASLGEGQGQSNEAPGTGIAGGSSGGGGGEVMAPSSATAAMVPVTQDNAWTVNYLASLVPPQQPGPMDTFLILLETRFKQIHELCLSPIPDIQGEGMRSLMLDPNLGILLPGLIRFIAEGIAVNEGKRDLNKLVLFLRMVMSIAVNETVRFDQRLADFIPSVRTCILTPELCGSPPREMHWQVRVYAAKIVAQLCHRVLVPQDSIQAERVVFNSILQNPQTPVGTLYGAIAGLGELGYEVIIADLLPKILDIAGRVEASLNIAHSPEEHKEGSKKIIELVVTLLSPVLNSLNTTQEVSSEYKRKFGIFGESLLTAVVALRENEERLRNQAPALYSALTASASTTTSALGIMGFNPTTPAATATATTTPTPKKRGRKRKTPAKGAADADQLNTSEGNDSATGGLWTPGPSTSTMTPSPASNLSTRAPNVVAMCKDMATPATATPKRRGRKRKASVPTPTPAKDESAPAHSGGSDPTPVHGSNGDIGDDEQPQAAASRKSTIDGLVNFLMELKKEGGRDRDDKDAAGTGE